MIIGEELKKRLLLEGIKPSDVINVETTNDKKKRTVTTKINFIDGSEYELVDDFIWYAARKNKKW
jgi:hypothetical protein